MYVYIYIYICIYLDNIHIHSSADYVLISGSGTSEPSRQGLCEAT